MRVIITTILATLLTMGFALAGGSGGEDESNNAGEESSSPACSVCTRENVPDGFVDEADDPANDIKRSFDYSVLRGLGHPRLLMTEGEFEILREKLTTGKDDNPTLCKLHSLAMELADNALAGNPAIRYGNTLTDARNVLKCLFNLSYAYRVTGKEEYLTQALADIREVCAFPDWHNNWLQCSEITTGMALAYDWLYYDLPYEDRVEMHRKMVEYALSRSLEANFIEMTGNWNQVCNSSMTAAALVLYEKDKTLCADVIENALESNRAAMSDIYSPDGEYWQGIGYWTYGTGYEALMLQNLDMCFGSTGGLTETVGFDKTGEYILYMVGSSGECFNYADGGNTTQIARVASWWFAMWQNNPNLLLHELRMLENNAGKYTGGNIDDRIFPAIVTIANRMDIENADIVPPSSPVWSGRAKADVCMIRSDWNFDKNDCYIGVKGGAANIGHTHADAGSFVFDSQGVRWSCDIGRQEYDTVRPAIKAAGGELHDFTQKSLRWEVYRLNNLSHSTLAFDASDGSVDKLHVTDQVVDGYVAIEETYETGDLGVRLNLTPAYCDQVADLHRTLKLVDGELHVIDEVTAKEGLDAPMEWRMVTKARVDVQGDKEIFSRWGKKLSLEAYNSASLDMNYTTWVAARPESWEPYTWDLDNNGYTVAGYTATIPAGSSVTFTTVLAPVE